jgi:dephospho-CoA kinase
MATFGEEVPGIIQETGLKMPVIGVTGSIGTGKSTVSGMFRRMGAAVIDADEISHSIMEPGKPAWKKVVSVFGKKLLRRGGYIDRKVLGKIVFSDSGGLDRLCGILHPEIYRHMRAAAARIRRADKSAIIILDVPLLLESGGRRYIDKLVVVTAPKRVQIERACGKLGISRSEALKRISAQLPLKEKAAAADYVVDNGGSPIATEKQVRQIWKKLVGA